MHTTLMQRVAARVGVATRAKAAIVTAMLGLAGAPAVAQTTYTKLDNTTALNLSGAWSAGGPPTSTTVGAFAGTYNTAGSLSGTWAGGITWGGITIGSISGSAAGTVNLGGAGNASAGSSITIGSLGIDMSGANQNLVVNSATTTFNASQTWNVASGRNLRFGTTAAGAGNALITGTNANAVITIAGSGVVDLNQGASGDGTGFAAAGFSGFAGKWQVNSGATLRGARNGATAFGSSTAADAINLNGGTLADGGISGFVGNWTWTTNISLAASTSSAIDQQIASGTNRSLKLMGNFSGSGNLLFRESGATDAFNSNDRGFIISGTNNTMSGTVTIGGATENGVAGRLSSVRVGGVFGATDTSINAGTAGTLGTANVVNNGVLTLSRSDAWTFGNTMVSGTGMLRIGSTSITGAGTQDVTLSGANTGWTGGIEVLTGTMRAAALSNLGGGYLAVKNNATFFYTGSGSESTTRVLWMDTGAANIDVSDASGWLTINPSGGTRNQAFTKTGAGTLEIGGAFTGGASVRASGGTLRLTSAASSYTGTTTLVAGALEVAKLDNGGANSSIGASSNAAANLVFNGGSLSYIGTGDSTDRAFTITSAPTINANGSGALSWTGASPTFTTANTPYRITLGGTSTADNTWGTVLADNGTGAVSLRKAGAGKWVLTGANTFTGTVGIAAGTLELGGAGTLGSGSYAGAITNDGTLSVATSANQTLAGAISGAGSLSKGGAGKLTLSAVNTYAGNTTITSGTLEVTGAGQLGGGAYAGAIANDGTLWIASSASQTLSGGITGGGGLVKEGAGQLTLGGVNSFSGPTAVNAGTLVVDGQVTTSGITVTGAMLGGSGTTAAVTLVGGVISPGNSPGTLTVGDLAWDATSSYDWEMYDYLGTAGSTTGWDLVSGTGTLSVTGTGFTFNLLSMTGTNTRGPLPPERWSQTTSGTFRVASFAGGITAPGGTWWTINTGSFAPFSSLTGSFSLLVGANDIDLVYTYTPPPAYVWTAGSGSWSAASNWSTDPAVPAGTAELIFAGAGGTATNDITSGTGAGELTTVTGLTFSGSASGAYTLDGNAFTLGSAGIVNQSASLQTVQNGLTLASASLANADTAGLSLSGTIDTAGYGFTVTGAATTTLSGVVTGSGGLAKLGAGTLVLAGGNDYTGGTLITSGTVVVGDGATSGVLPGDVTNDATLVFDRSDAVTHAGAIGGTGSLVKIGVNTLTLTGSNGYTGPTTISGGTLAFAGAANQTLSGPIGGAGAVVQGGPGALVLTGSNSYAGGTTITGGTLQLGVGGMTGSIEGDVTNDGTLAFNRSDAVAFPGVVSGIGGLVQLGTGATTLTATNTYTGATAITSGTLVIGGAGQLGGGTYAGAISNAGVLSVATSANQTLSGTISGGGTLSKSGAGTLTLAAANGYSGGTTLSTGRIRMGDSAALGTGTATLNGGALSSDGGTARTLTNAVAIGSDVTLGDATDNGLLTFSGGVNLGGAVRQITAPSNVTLSGVVTNGGLTKAGAGVLRLSNANTYTLGTTIASGTVVAANSAALGSSGTVTLNTAATGAANTGLLVDASAASVTIARPISVANEGSGVTTIGSGALSGSNQAIFSGAITLARDVTLVGFDGGDRTQFQGGIAGTGNVTVTSSGTGRVIFLTTANTFSGNLLISPNSRLQLSDGSATANSLIPDTADVTVGAGGILSIAKGNNSESINALLGSGTVQAVTSTPTLIVGASGGSGTFSGIIRDNGGTLALTKQGAGTQTITGSLAYTRTTIVTAGTLAIAVSTSLGSGLGPTLPAGDTGTLAFGANTVTIGNGNANSFHTGGLDGSGTMAMRGGSLTIMQSTGAAGSAGNGQFMMGTPSPTAFALDTGASTTDRKDFGWMNDVGQPLLLSSLTGFGAIRSDAGGTAGQTTVRFITVNQAIDTQFDGALVSHRSGANANRVLTFEKQGAGTLTLAGFIGKQTVSAGTGAVPVNLVVNGGGLIVTNPDNTQTTNTGAINTTGTVTITSGTLGFAPQALVNTAGTLGVASIRMNGGVLRWHGTNTQDITAGGRLTLISGSTATFDTNGNDVTLGTALGGGAIASPVVKIGAGTLTLSGANLYTGDTTISGGTLAIGGAGSLGGGSYAGTITMNGGFAVNTSANQTLSGSLTGVGGLAKGGAGTLTLLNATNDYAGGSTISGGTVSYAAGALGTVGTVTIGGGALRWESGNTDDISARLALVDATTATFDTNGNDVTFASPLGGGTTAALTKTGGGTLTLAAATAYSGLTTVSGGTLAVTGTADIASSSGLNLTTSGAAFDMSGASGDRTIGSLAGVDGSAIQLGGNNLTAGGAANATFAGAIAGTGGFTKTGAGSLALTGNNAYTGPTTITTGTLEVGGSGVLGGGAYPGAITNAGTLLFTTSADQSLGGVIDGAGALVKGGAGTLTLSASNSFSGPVALDSGTLVFAAGGLGTGTTTLNGGALRWDAGNTEDVSARLVLVNGVTAVLDTNGNAVTLAGGLGAGTSAGLTKVGDGTLTLSGSNGYTGATAVNEGTLAIAGAGSIASSPALGIASGATLDIAGASGVVNVGTLTGDGSVTLGGNTLRTTVVGESISFHGVVSGSGGFTKAGADALFLTAAQTFTGTATVEAGALVLAAGNELEQAATIAVLASGVLDTPGLTVVLDQTLAGHGTVFGPVTFAAGGILSPGGSVGTLTNDGSTTWNGAMRYVFEVNDATGTAGSDPGWDRYNVTGGLTLAASQGTPIIIDLTSLTGTSTGPAANFDPNGSYQWLIADAGSEISTFDPLWFSVDTTNFLNLPGSLDFSVVRGDALFGPGNNADQLYVVYAAIPEPGTLALAAIGLAAAGLAAARRRRR